MWTWCISTHNLNSMRNLYVVSCRIVLVFFYSAIYFRYRGTVIGNRYGNGSGPILLDNVKCVGHETSIHNCRHAGWGRHNCDHSNDVSVSCGTSPVYYGTVILITCTPAVSSEAGAFRPSLYRSAQKL